MDVLERLRQEGVEFEVSHHPEAFTAQQLAAVEHVPGRNVAKPVIVQADGEYVVCVLPASRRLNLSAVGDALYADGVELTSEAKLAELFPDCELGAEPPIGVFFGLRTLVDYQLMADEYIVFQAGSHTRSVRMAWSDFERLTDPSYGAISIS
ncbi:MAG: YbaK/EbsC family protein [Phycisphaerales bacterium]|nr:MAG: YbaK/EbsC family protein [Phycisphaerales bacterium]